MKEQPQRPMHTYGLFLGNTNTGRVDEICFYRYEEILPYIKHFESENKRLQERIAELEKENEYLTSDKYLEEIARAGW